MHPYSKSPVSLLVGFLFKTTSSFVKRKQFYSINVEAVCDSDAFITNIVARWPRSTHDSRIFENCKIVDKLREGTIDGILVGESGYACREYLMTPILKSKNAGEVRCNTAHRRTRCVIERCFGLRFPCLHLGLRTAPGECSRHYCGHGNIA